MRHTTGFVQMGHIYYKINALCADDQRQLDPVSMTRIRQPKRRMGAKYFLTISYVFPHKLLKW